MGKFKQLFLEAEIGSIKTDIRSFLARNGNRSPRGDYKYEGFIFSIDRGVDDQAFYVRAYDLGTTERVLGTTPDAEADVRSAQSGYLTKGIDIDPVDEDSVSVYYKKEDKDVMSNGYHSPEELVGTLIKIAKK
jgi:hypothetical protein